MKTYILSVNTLMWNLTSERHDNSAPCLGLILPIRWVTPPPNSYWSVSLGVTIAKSSHLDCLQHWFNFLFIFTAMIWSYTDIYTYICVLSSTTFTYSYFFVLPFLLSECDRTLPPLCYTQPNLFTNSSCAFYLELVQNLHCVLDSWRNCERNF